VNESGFENKAVIIGIKKTTTKTRRPRKFANKTVLASISSPIHKNFTHHLAGGELGPLVLASVPEAVFLGGCMLVLSGTTQSVVSAKNSRKSKKQKMIK